MEWLAKLIPESVIEKMADSLFLKFTSKWVALGAAATVTHGFVSPAQATADQQRLIEILAGSGVLALNHLLEYLLHWKHIDREGSAYASGAASMVDATAKTNVTAGDPAVMANPGIINPKG